MLGTVVGNQSKEELYLVCWNPQLDRKAGCQTLAKDTCKDGIEHSRQKALAVSGALAGNYLEKGCEGEEDMEKPKGWDLDCGAVGLKGRGDGALLLLAQGTGFWRLAMREQVTLLRMLGTTALARGRPKYLAWGLV